MELIHNRVVDSHLPIWQTWTGRWLDDNRWNGQRPLSPTVKHWAKQRIRPLSILQMWAGGWGSSWNWERREYLLQRLNSQSSSKALIACTCPHLSPLSVQTPIFKHSILDSDKTMAQPQLLRALGLPGSHMGWTMTFSKDRSRFWQLSSQWQCENTHTHTLNADSLWSAALCAGTYTHLYIVFCWVIPFPSNISFQERHLGSLSALEHTASAVPCGFGWGAKKKCALAFVNTTVSQTSRLPLASQAQRTSKDAQGIEWEGTATPSERLAIAWSLED